MENPQTWNNCIKILNNSLDYGNISVNLIIDILINNNLLLIDKNNLLLFNAIKDAVDSFKYEMDNQCCGNSLGNKIYFKLKEINAVT